MSSSARFARVLDDLVRDKGAISFQKSDVGQALMKKAGISKLPQKKVYQPRSTYADEKGMIPVWEKNLIGQYKIQLSTKQKLKMKKAGDYGKPVINEATGMVTFTSQSGKVIRGNILDVAGILLQSERETLDIGKNQVVDNVDGNERMSVAAIWLGLLNPKTDSRRVHQELKSAVRKNDVANFCHLLRLLANDPKVDSLMAKQVGKAPDEGFELDELPERLEVLFKLGDAPPRRRKAVKKKIKRSI